MSILEGLRVVEFDAIGPTPFCGKLLADHGATVIRIGRPGGQPNGIRQGSDNLLLEGRPTFELDLKIAENVARVRALLKSAHILIEGFRPGVMERLGLGPQECLKLNPGLVYGRMTGYGQSGPLSAAAGHDVNFIALAGVLHTLGDPQAPPPPPLNLIGDFGGGGMLLAFGVLAARLRSVATGRGAVVDAAMIDGAAQLMGMILGLRNAGVWNDARGSNILDGGAPFYRCYRTRDGRFIAVGAIEPKFYAAMRAALGIDQDPLFDRQWDRSRWPEMHAKLEEVVAQRSLEEWAAACEDPDACISPVLGFSDLPDHPHVRARATIRRLVEGSRRERLQPQPAPRFLGEPSSSVPAHASLAEILAQWDLEEADRESILRSAQALIL